MEKDLKALSDGSAGKEDVSRVRAEIKKLHDGLHIGQSINNRFSELASLLTLDTRIPRSSIPRLGNS